MDDWMSVFRVTDQALAAGVTDQDIADVIENYDPAVHEAPIVLGHPKHDKPAYGWVESLKAAGNTLLAKPKQVAAEFAEWVGAGRYKKISVSFYSKENPYNPTPGKLYLKHVGYQGEAPPVIKGLPDHVFAEEEGGELVTVEFSESDFDTYVFSMLGDFLLNLREFLIDQFGRDAADQVVNRWMPEELRSVGRQVDEPIAAMGAAFAETNVLPTFQEETNMATQEELDQREQELNDRSVALAAQEQAAIQQARKLEFSEALETLVTAGKITPAEKPAHLRQLQMLDAIPADRVANFAEDGQTNFSPTAEYLAKLEAQPQRVTFTEVTGGKAPTPTDEDVDPVKMATGIEKIRSEAAAAGKTLSFAEAQHQFLQTNQGDK